MLKKIPKPTIWRFVKTSAKTLFVIEAVLFACSYGIYYRMNTNRDFRQYMNDNFPYFLEGFYTVGELFGDKKQRELDANIWKQIKDSTYLKKTE